MCQCVNVQRPLSGFSNFFGRFGSLRWRRCSRNTSSVYRMEVNDFKYLTLPFLIVIIMTIFKSSKYTSIFRSIIFTLILPIVLCCQVRKLKFGQNIKYTLIRHKWLMSNILFGRSYLLNILYSVSFIK